jgi:hypothetical protein
VSFTAEALDKNVDERAHLARRELARRAHDVEPESRRRIIDKHGLERASSDVRVDEKVADVSSDQVGINVQLPMGVLSAICRDAFVYRANDVLPKGEY